MSNTLNLIVPPLETQGPEYAQNINTDLIRIIPHNHDGIDNGALINLNAQILSGDLSLDGYNLSNVRSEQFNNNSSVLTGSQDTNSIYVQQNILGFNNSNGIFVPIVEGNTLAITSLPLTNFTIRSVSSNFTILPTDTYCCIDINSTGGPVTGTLPIAASIVPTALGRFFIFRDVSQTASTNNITIQVPPGSSNTFGNGNTSYIINNNGGYVAFFTDGISKWFPWTQNVYSTEIVSYQNSTENYTGTLINLDAASRINLNGGIMAFTNGQRLETGLTVITQNGAQLNTGTFAQRWSGTSTSLFDSGSTLTMGVGSNHVINGTLNGTTTGGALAMNNSLATDASLTINGGMSINSNVNFLTGNTTGTIVASATTISGTGLVLNLTNSSTLTTSRSVNTTLGNVFLKGVVSQTVVEAAGTYNVDSGSDFDLFVCLNVGQTGTWNVNLPASPATGRIIYIQDVGGTNQTTASFTVNINGNGNQISLGNATGGATSSIQILGGGSQFAWWGLGLIFVQGLWVEIQSIGGI